MVSARATFNGGGGGRKENTLFFGDRQPREALSRASATTDSFEYLDSTSKVCFQHRAV